jgi:hypothetical protein
VCSIYIHLHITSYNRDELYVGTYNEVVYEWTIIYR